MTMILSGAFCLILLVRLVFFSCEHRRYSVFFWRAVLFATTIYLAQCLISYLYLPTQAVSWLEVLFHFGLLIGALFIDPSDLPWNGSYVPARTASPDQLPGSASRLR